MWMLAAGGIGYGYKSFHGYQQTRQRYHLTLTQSLYFQNLDSNAGVLMRLFDEAEEQECRMAILAYWCLWRYAGPEGWTAADLDASVELYLDRYADLAISCRDKAALAQLTKLHLIESVGERFRALSPARAVETLQADWNLPFPTPPGRNGERRAGSRQRSARRSSSRLPILSVRNPILRALLDTAAQGLYSTRAKSRWPASANPGLPFTLNIQEVQSNWFDVSLPRSDLSNGFQRSFARLVRVVKYYG